MYGRYLLLPAPAFAVQRLAAHAMSRRGTPCNVCSWSRKSSFSICPDSEIELDSSLRPKVHLLFTAKTRGEDRRLFTVRILDRARPASPAAHRCRRHRATACPSWFRGVVTAARRPEVRRHEGGVVGGGRSVPGNAVGSCDSGLQRLRWYELRLMQQRWRQ